MAEQKGSSARSTEDLAKIRGRLREGALEKDDLRKLEAVVKDVEEATRALRAAIIE